MGIDFTLFDNINELVYVSDPETHELIYMNKALQKELGDSAVQYQGKKCYNLLQGKEAPCEFCTNDKLTEGQTYSWSYVNPILKKSVLLQDTIYEEKGKKYRIEIAIEKPAAEETVKTAGGVSRAYLPNEIAVSECLQYALGGADYEETFNRMLSYIGKRFQCDRAYIFEINGNETVSNTYEWCAEGVTAQKELLQNEPLITITYWLEAFEKNELILIENVEDLKYTEPLTYAALVPQNIQSLAACPIKREGEVVGFLGVDNPDIGQITLIASFFRVIEYIAVSFMKRRDLARRLEYVSYHDKLTDALNRSAYKEKEMQIATLSRLGVLYGDITGLKQTNDRFGHRAGDILICDSYTLLRQVFTDALIYRMGGDEFLVLCEEISEEEFIEKCEALREEIAQSDCNIAIGYSWGDPSVEYEDMIAKAEAAMYYDKQEYYNGVDAVTGERRDRRRRRREAPDAENGEKQQKEHEIFRSQTSDEFLDSVKNATNLYDYLLQNQISVNPLLEVISRTDSNVALCVGDLKNNIFYISDNLKETMGFSSCVLDDFMAKWERLICYPEDKQEFRKDVRALLHRTKEQHDLKYRVYDKDGRQFWVHSTGRVCWEEQNEWPSYFVGCISRQEFMVDPVTALPRERAAVTKIKDVCSKGLHCTILGIGLNYFNDINKIKGRDTADNLLMEINGQWSEKLSGKAWFYRLDGIRFLMIMNPACTDPIDSIVKEIKRCVRNSCSRYNVVVKYPCSVGVYEYDNEMEDAESAVDKIFSLIEMAKSDIEKEYVMYSALEGDKQGSRAEYLLQLNSDVANHFQNFRVVIQPIVSTAQEKISGGEVLMRWKCDGKDISPSVFVPLLEKSGLVQQAGRWVFEEAVRNCRRLIMRDPQFYLSFNFSYLQVSDAGFLTFAKNTLQKYEVPGSALMMELTENHFDNEPEKLMKLIDGCKKLGMRIALDDFGSGYSSLGLLMRYPVNVVKLDRSLLSELMDSRERQVFLQTIVYACHQFGKKVCVEGVETQESARIVEQTGSDLIQGYYYYKPLELAEFYDTYGKQQDADYSV